MKIILVRHGESEQNIGVEDSKDSRLTKKGILQAQSLGKKLKKNKIKIDEIYTSNLLRSKETADLVSKIVKVPVKKGFEELNEYEEEILKDRIRRIFNNRLRKLKKFVKEITRKKNKNETILIIAHGITNKIILGILLQIPLKKQLLRFRHQYTSLTVLTWHKYFKNWRLESMNDIHHLPEKLK